MKNNKMVRVASSVLMAGAITVSTPGVLGAVSAQEDVKTEEKKEFNINWVKYSVRTIGGKSEYFYRIDLTDELELILEKEGKVIVNEENCEYKKPGVMFIGIGDGEFSTLQKDSIDTEDMENSNPWLENHKIILLKTEENPKYKDGDVVTEDFLKENSIKIEIPGYESLELPKEEKEDDKVEPVGKDIVINVGEALNPEDGISNKDELGDATYKFKEEIDNNKGVDKLPATVIVTYADDTEKEVPILVTIIAKEEPVLPVVEKEIVLKPALAGARSVVVETKNYKEGDKIVLTVEQGIPTVRPDKPVVYTVKATDGANIEIPLNSPLSAGSTVHLDEQNFTVENVLSADSPAIGSKEIEYTKEHLDPGEDYEIVLRVNGKVEKLGEVEFKSGDKLDLILKRDNRVIDMLELDVATKTTPGRRPSKNKPKDRISGSNRLETAVAVSKNMYPRGTSTVILANKEKFSDVLTATPFAAQKNAPILFVNKDNIPKETMDEIKRLGAKNIYINGGEASVSKAVEKQLGSMSIERFAGADRYETAVKIGEKIREKGNKDIVEIANGTIFADALSMSSLAVKDRAPIVLVKKDSIPASSQKALKEWSAKKVNIAGLQNTVSEGVEKSLEGKISRYGGADRYETSAKIAKAARPNATTGVYTSGKEFADALVAGPFAAKKSAPILLVKKNTVPGSIVDYSKNIKKVYIIGGENTIDNTVMERLLKIAK